MDVKRKDNEKKFRNYKETKDRGRIYWFEIKGKSGWKAHYVKEVDNKENTIKFYQEICNPEGKLVEIHEKYPIDKGHKKV